jgi:hypothetical protein
MKTEAEQKKEDERDAYLYDCIYRRIMDVCTKVEKFKTIDEIDRRSVNTLLFDLRYELFEDILKKLNTK